MAASDVPILTASVQAVGKWGTWIVLAAAWLDTLTEAAGDLLTAARVALPMGEARELPRWLAAVHQRFRSPHHAVILLGAICAGLALLFNLRPVLEVANGFTLVRRVLEHEDYDGPDLLAPTRLYLDVARALRGRAKGFAHVTGGGIAGNLERVLPDGRRAELDWDAWDRPPVFEWLGRHVDEEELRRVFNLGIGWCAVVAEPQPGETVIGRVA